MTPNMIECSLWRFAHMDQGTFGIFRAPSLSFQCATLELPDRNNKPMLSRIPAGEYIANWEFSHRFRRMTYRLADTAPRVGILIHPANFGGDVDLDWQSDLSGCIALGSYVTHLRNTHGMLQLALGGSRFAVGKFEQVAAPRPLRITIIENLPCLSG